MAEVRPLKFVKVREELVAVTGDAVSSMILDRFLFFTRRGNRDDGWIWKSAKEMAEDDLFGVTSESTVRRRFRELVESGYLLQKEPETNDKAMLYRVRFGKLMADLEELGHHLHGWTDQPTPEVETTTDEEVVSDHDEPVEADPAVEDDIEETTELQAEMERKREKFQRIMEIQGLDSWLMEYSRFQEVPMSIGASMSIAQRIKTVFDTQDEARHYVMERFTELTGEVSERQVKRYLITDAKEWKDRKDKRAKEVGDEELKNRGDVRGTSWRDTDAAREFFGK